MRFRPLPVYPPVRRDITVMAAQGLTVSAIAAHVRGLGLPLLEDIVLVDCFEPKAAEGQDAVRNLTFRLTFRHADRTLKDTEVDKEREKVAQSLAATLGVRI